MLIISKNFPFLNKVMPQKTARNLFLLTVGVLALVVIVNLGLILLNKAPVLDYRVWPLGEAAALLAVPLGFFFAGHYVAARWIHKKVDPKETN